MNDRYFCEFGRAFGEKYDYFFCNFPRTETSTERNEPHFGTKPVNTFEEVA